jgi:NitT/TauT family transport system permease protein
MSITKRILLLTILVLAWEGCVRLPYVNELPSLVGIAQILWANLTDMSFLWDILLSLKRMVIGYSWVILIGILGGLILGKTQWLHDLLGPFIVASQAMPGIVWVPVATFIFGLTEAAVIFTIILGGTGIVLVNTDTGVRNVPQIFLQAARVMGAGGFKLFWHVIVPAATPKILDGLRLAWAFGWRALMAGELIVAIGGFGRRIQDVVYSRDMGQLLVLIIVIGLIGFMVDECVFKNIEKSVQRRWGLQGT